MQESLEPKTVDPHEAGARRWNFLVYLVLFFLLSVIGILVYAMLSQGGSDAAQTQDPMAIALSIGQEKLYLAAMTDYVCPCGACDLTLIDCHCPTAQQVQLAVRQRLQDGATAGEISQLLQVTFEAEKVRP